MDIIKIKKTEARSQKSEENLLGFFENTGNM